ncbi:MAG TPA: hypothetical protein EYP10_12350 [Armatimonadetes bacterium]|nr:hypothetical protein [Armatimonadota bacterium]
MDADEKSPSSIEIHIHPYPMIWWQCNYCAFSLGKLGCYQLLVKRLSNYYNNTFELLEVSFTTAGSKPPHHCIGCHIRSDDGVSNYATIATELHTGLLNWHHRTAVN